jgi:hypothetical protein
MESIGPLRCLRQRGRHLPELRAGAKVRCAFASAELRQETGLEVAAGAGAISPTGAGMRTHWYTSAEAPAFGQDLTALCKEVVKKAEPIKAVWDSDLSDEEFGLVTCRHCNREVSSWLRYVAVIQDGQQALDEERKCV